VNVCLPWSLTLSDPGKAINNLAVTYSELGRHQEALVMQERTLEFCRRVLPENHPNIGVTRLLMFDCLELLTKTYAPPPFLFDVVFDILCSRHRNGQSRS
jgi:hypothetical protein